MQLQRILVATDFSKASEKAFDQAVALARGAGDVDVHVLHRLAAPIPVFPPIAPPAGGSWSEMGPMLDEYANQLRQSAMRELEAVVARAPESVSVETSIEEVLEPEEAVAKKIESWKPDLLAVGTHGRHGLEKLVMGSIAARLLHHADTAVMLVRADSAIYDGDEPIGPVLVPIDFSDHSHRALAVARLVVTRFHGSLDLVHVVEMLRNPLTPAKLTSRFDTDPDLREKTLEALGDMLGENEGHTSAVDGVSVAGAILKRREEVGARLVVMGSRGLTGLPHLLVGSVAEKVARFSEVPVIIVK